MAASVSDVSDGTKVSVSQGGVWIGAGGDTQERGRRLPPPPGGWPAVAASGSGSTSHPLASSRTGTPKACATCSCCCCGLQLSLVERSERSGWAGGAGQRRGKLLLLLSCAALGLRTSAASGLLCCRGDSMQASARLCYTRARDGPRRVSRRLFAAAGICSTWLVGRAGASWCGCSITWRWVGDPLASSWFCLWCWLLGRAAASWSSWSSWLGSALRVLAACETFVSFVASVRCLL